MLRSMLVIFILILSIPFAANAAEQPEKGTLSIVYENDIFHSDSYYTNGFRVSWLSKPGVKSDIAMRLATYFPIFPADATVLVNYAFGQNMYTPKDITLENPPKDDRPYAGWLYGSVGLIAETGRQLDQIDFTFGMVGPASLGEETQKFVHKKIGSPEPKGWDGQLKNEPGFLVTYLRSWRSEIADTFLGMPYDITPHAGATFGNVFTYANAGATFRYGKELPLDYGSPRVQPSLPGSGYFKAEKGFSWYLFAGAEGRAVAHNIFLDGNTLEDSGRVKKRYFVGDIQSGVVLTLNNIRLSYTHVLRTQEFKTQDSHYQAFRTLSLSMQF
ncbi:MAG: DUF2219 domain-containing protein [Denitrovibrio sp.]|nr:MAG: DUF2219 domain-containing protein [Denitrovibrio sp.]